MPFKDIFHLQLWQPACLAEQNILGNFGSGYYVEHFCIIILHLNQGCLILSSFRISFKLVESLFS